MTSLPDLTALGSYLGKLAATTPMKIDVARIAADLKWTPKRDSHDDWRELNVAFAPPQPVIYTVAGLTVTPMSASEAFDAARTVLEVYFRETQRRIEEAFFLGPLRSEVQCFDPFADGVFTRSDTPGPLVVLPPT